MNSDRDSLVPGRVAMFPELNSILNTSPDHFPRGEFTLVSDRQADASFLIHHFLSFYLRAGCKVCFLGLVQSFSHYSAVSQRLGVNLAQAKEKGQLVFLEGLKETLSILLRENRGSDTDTLSFLRSPCTDLRGLFGFVRGCVRGEQGPWGPPVLIVDDLSVMLSLGVSADALLDFSHYCQATVCSELQGNVVMLTRGEDEEGEDDEDLGRLLTGLAHSCHLALRVRGLATGYCKDIHGEVELCWRGGRTSVNFSGLTDHRRVYQYKIQDKGVSFFARGTSSAVL
ncbi:elongator complex protein 6 isoform X1 [Lepisosteus oculatus]|uniref:elongator complex protein 6 isoform X1 n=2 Tax=Lepisosteus oculatus TaxID=7918 RepID=UPI0035F51B50